MLYGRAAEQATIERLLEDARAGRGAALVIRGDPGIGKTALLDHAAHAAGQGGMRLIRAGAAEPEAGLPYAGLHLLLGPELSRRFALPQPQRDILSAALGLQSGPPRGRFLVGLSVLSLLAGLAGDGALLCLIDDAQWLDKASADVLLFASRRLDAERIVILFAARDYPSFPAAGLPVMELAGLDPDSALALLLAHGGNDLPAGTRSRLLDETRGNPLGLTELPSAYLSAAPGAGHTGGGNELPLTSRLQEAFGAQVRRLPAATRTLLLAAAAESNGDIGVLLEALDAAPPALEPAERTGLIRIEDEKVIFRHPLVRSAVYRGATFAERLVVHGALAGAFRRPADAERRAWHLTVAATHPAEKIAAELEESAAQAIARGGYAAAAAAYERAARLTADPEALARRLILAAEAAVEIGDFEHAHTLANQAADQTPDPVDQARLAAASAQAELAQGRPRAAHRLLADAAAQIADLDAARAARMLVLAAHAAWAAGDAVILADTAARLTAVPRTAMGPYVPVTELVLRLAGQAAGCYSDDPARLAGLVAQASRARVGDLQDLMLIATITLLTGRVCDARGLLTQLVTGAREQGRAGWLPRLLSCLAEAQLADGRLQEGLATANEALRVGRGTGQLPCSALSGMMAYIAAVDGAQDRCRQLAAAALAGPGCDEMAGGQSWAHWALGVLHLGSGRPDTALAELESVWRGPARFQMSALRSIPDLVEAAVRLGQRDRVAEPLARFCGWAQQSGSPGAASLADRCRALMAGDDAEQHYLAALGWHEKSFERARTQLLYGSWLRRSRRKAEALEQLTAAVEQLNQYGAAPWAAQARAELRALSTTALRPAQPRRPQLTPQELQVARLAAEGMPNRDIAARLFLSPRTVSYHLYKAYPKLGITSRHDLDSAML
jgi:DNA-binding CsgD family transcriptional regulator